MVTSYSCLWIHQIGLDSGLEGLDSRSPKILIGARRLKKGAWPKGLEPRCGLTPPPPSSFTHHLSIIFKWLTAEADALPLFWEFYSGGGVICGASMHYDWNSFYLFAHFIGSFALLPINCTLSHSLQIQGDTSCFELNSVPEFWSVSMLKYIHSWTRRTNDGGFLQKETFSKSLRQWDRFYKVEIWAIINPPSLPWSNLLGTDSAEKYSLAKLDHQKERYSVQMRSACFCLWILCAAFEQVFCESVSNDVFFRMLY